MRGCNTKKIIVISSSEVMNYETTLTFDLTHNKMVTSILTECLLYHLRIQTAELDVNVHNT